MESHAHASEKVLSLSSLDEYCLYMTFKDWLTIAVLCSRVIEKTVTVSINTTLY